MSTLFFFKMAFHFKKSLEKKVVLAVFTRILKKCPKMPKTMGHFFILKKMPEGFKKCPIFDLGH